MTTKERHCQLVMESQKRHKEKHNARHALRKKIKRGKIPHFSELPCVDCGSKSECYDHAYGYDGENRFKVDAVCWPCHRKRGKGRGEYRGGGGRPKGVVAITKCSSCSKEISHFPSVKRKFCSSKCTGIGQRKVIA